MSGTNSVSSLDRRQLMAGMAAVGLGGISGCLGDDGSDDAPGDTDSDDEGLGERVPSLTYAFWSDFRPAATMERYAPTVVSGLSELGLEVDAQAIGGLEILGDMRNDERNYEISASVNLGTSMNPSFFMDDYDISSAGANGASNYPNYASCEYSEYNQLQKDSVGFEERQENVMEALRVQSNDVSHWPLMDIYYATAWNQQEIELAGAGERGTSATNHNVYLKSSSIDGSPLITQVDTETTDSTIMNLLADGTISVVIWNNLIYSPLVELNEDYEVEGCIAEDWEISDDFTSYTFSLGDNQFHDGTPLTASDVEYTITLIRENADLYPEARAPPITDIEVIDDETIRIDTDDTTGFILDTFLPSWGIVPEHIYEEAGASDNPDGFDPSEVVDDDDLVVVGSGPYLLREMTDELVLESWGQHRKHNPDHDIIPKSFAEDPAAVRALEAGEINLMSSIPLNLVEDFEDDERLDVEISFDMTHWSVNPQNSFPPFKFHAMREAGHRAINREQVNQTGAFGYTRAWPVATAMGIEHPMFDFESHEDLDDGFLVVDPAGDIEAAREVLEEAGFGWDDDGNLHYPPDADLSPTWPEGSEPAEHPDQFTCVDELM